MNAIGRSAGRRALFAFLAALLVCLAPLSTPLVGTATAQENDEEIVVEVVGTLHYVWGDVGPDSKLESTEPIVTLYEQGTNNTFALDNLEAASREQGGPLQFNGKLVEVTGVLDPETNRITVQEVSTATIIESHHGISHRSGSQQWVTVLCRFGDSTGTTPESVSFFEDLMDEMDTFWQEVSYDTIDLAGSDEIDWVNMPQNRSAYINSTTNRARLGLLAQDCASAADSQVNFPDYDGINFVFNEDLGCCSWGGGVTLNIDGTTKGYSATWMATWGWGNQDVMGQEMGHGFGLPHSSGPYGATYDSQWDVMSSGGSGLNPDPQFGNMGVHTVSFHKDALRWIPSARKYVATNDADQLVFIERLAQPATSDDYLMAEIPIGSSSARFYSVEVRQFEGYDTRVPDEAVLIHKVNTTRGDRLAQVVDADGDGDANDAGAQWIPGETFEDSSAGISVFVREMTATGAYVIINPEPPAADAGGPYTTPEGTDVTLDATGSSDPGGDPLTYAWDLDDDGDFDDATGATPTFDQVGRDGTFDVCVEVTDDVGNVDTDCATVTVTNVPPSVAVSSDAPQDEGATVTITGTVSDPGWLDPLSATVDWGDGTTDALTGTTENTRPDATLSFTASHRYGDNGSYTVEVCGADDDTTTCETISVDVDNVAPTVTGGADQAIDEGDVLASHASFTDPGWLDTYTATVDWGDPDLGTSPATVAMTTTGGPGTPDAGNATATRIYGDNGVFTVTTTVTDDDGGAGAGSFEVTVSNVAPTATIDTSGATVIDGVPTILGHAGEPVEFDARATDPGSDDLRFTWDFDDGSPPVTTDSLVNPPDADPPSVSDPTASPTVQPRNVTDARNHTFGEACVYEPTLTVDDDDGGQDTSQATVVITGTADRTHPTGWWHKQYMKSGARSDFDTATLGCYLEITRAVSTVFDEEVPLSTIEDAEDVLVANGRDARHLERFDRELLAAMLNLANGGVDFDQAVVDADRDGTPETTFADAVTTAESVRLDPDSTRQEIDEQRRLLHQINQFVDRPAGGDHPGTPPGLLP